MSIFKEIKNKSRLFSLSRPKSLDLGNLSGKKQNMEYISGMVNENFMEKENQNDEIIPVKQDQKVKTFPRKRTTWRKILICTLFQE